MNSGAPAPASNGHPAQPAGGMTLDDVLYTLFRHKWLILGFVCLGIAGAGAVRLLRPPLYVSQAKLMVHYVSEVPAPTSGNNETMSGQPLDSGTEAIIRSQIEILSSFDLAKSVAEKIGPARILARKGGGSNLLVAAGVICSGIEVEPPRTSILKVSFKHPDPDLVQPVLNALIQTFMDMHNRIYSGGDTFDDFLIRQREELRQKLAQRDQELKRLQKEANILFADDLKHSYEDRINQAQRALMDAQRDLAEHRALMGTLGLDGQGNGSMSNAVTSIPAETMANYGEVISDLEDLKKEYRTLLRTYASEYPSVLRTKSEIEKATQEKQNLEQRYPALKQMVLDGSGAGTNAPGGDVKSELDAIKRLNALVAFRGAALTNLEAEASQALEKEPKIAELKRQRDEEERSYLDVVRKIEQRQIGESAMASKAPNMSPVESPTPPGLDRKKMLKLAGAAFAGCAGLGLGLAFLIDLVLDRSVKRSVDVERRLRLPLFLSIPDKTWSGGPPLPWRRKPALAQRNGANGKAPAEMTLDHWNADQSLQIYAEGLRERILTFFEVRNLNLKKPKLVAVTGCNHGAGVSTLAGGLATALSKTGDGNVLLVDMNGDQGPARTFYKGKPGCCLADVLNGDTRADAQIEQNLFLANMNQGAQQIDDKLVKVLPSRFTHLMPKLKASDYDFIIFDMPPVSQTSFTPRLAGYMDLVLLVLESERTSQHAATRASALMRESRANVAAVLNKSRQHLPAMLAQE